MMMEGESWSLGWKQQIYHLASQQNMNYGHKIKTNVLFLNLRENMRVVNLFPRVRESMCKLLFKHRICVYSSCGDNQLPGALPRVVSLNEHASSTFK